MCCEGSHRSVLRVAKPVLRRPSGTPRFRLVVRETALSQQWTVFASEDGSHCQVSVSRPDLYHMQDVLKSLDDEVVDCVAADDLDAALSTGAARSHALTGDD